MIARMITHYGGDFAGTTESTASATCEWRQIDLKTDEDYAVISVTLARLPQELLVQGKRERISARRLIRAVGRRESRIGWRGLRMPRSNAVQARTPEHPHRLRLMKCNRWD